MIEVWKFIPDREQYLISNQGRVRNNKTNALINPFLKISKDSPNYKRYRISLRKKGKMKSFCIHLLVAQMFVENPNNYKKVLFRDNDYRNTSSENLIWVSDEEFKRYFKRRTSEITYKYYGNEPKPVKAICQISGKEKMFDSISDAAAFFSTKVNMISRVLKGTQKHHKDHRFELLNEPVSMKF